ncbi:Ribonuclease H-like domain containing protein, partial [Parasponia andersonii]
DSVSVCWIKSGFGCLELNTDAAYDHHVGIAGLGFITRNHDGCVMAAGFNGACLINNVTMIKALAAGFGIQVAQHPRLFPCSMVTDGLSAVNLIQGISLFSA